MAYVPVTERSWSSGNAFDKFVAHVEMVASQAGWLKKPLGNLLNSLQYLTLLPSW